MTGVAAASPPPVRAPALYWRLLLALAALKLSVHLALAGRYGYFRDELYFLDCGRHLDWGYVDHAPLIGLLARLALTLGGSLPVLRAFAALAGAGLVVLTGALAWRFGGGRFAQGLAALCVIAAPIYLGTDSLFTMNAFEPLFWMGAVYVLIDTLQTAPSINARSPFDGPRVSGRTTTESDRDPLVLSPSKHERGEVRHSASGDARRWVLFGLLVGLGLMNKHSTVFFGVAVVAGLLLTRDRRQFTGPGPWVATCVALLVFAPNLVWQVRHGFPTIELLRNVADSGKNVVLGPLAFVGEQILILHPVLLPLWGAGLVYLFGAAGGRWRALGWTFVVCALLMFALRAKSYYLAPMYPMLFAAGAVAMEIALAQWALTRQRRWPQAVVAGGVVVAAVPMAFVALPILAPERFVAYQSTLGIGPPQTEVSHTAALPQIFADQFGWEEFVAEMARVYHALPADERRRAVLFAGNYGEAGAINLFGPALGLPRAISGHQSYFLWGYGATGDDAVIITRGRRENLQAQCQSVEQVGMHFHPWGLPGQNGLIFVCRGLKTPLAELWPRMKVWR